MKCTYLKGKENRIKEVMDAQTCIVSGAQGIDTVPFFPIYFTTKAWRQSLYSNACHYFILPRGPRPPIVLKTSLGFKKVIAWALKG
jgi:hypothetical protein